MARVVTLKTFVSERLAAAAEEIFAVVERALTDYEKENSRQRDLLNIIFRPRLTLHKIDQQSPEPAHTKEEQGKPFINVEGEPSAPEQGEDADDSGPAREVLPLVTNDAQHQVEENLPHSVKTTPSKAQRQPYHCSFCGKYYSYKSELTRHMKCHTRKNPSFTLERNMQLQGLWLDSYQKPRVEPEKIDQPEREEEEEEVLNHQQISSPDQEEHLPLQIRQEHLMKVEVEPLKPKQQQQQQQQEEHADNSEAAKEVLPVMMFNHQSEGENDGANSAKGTQSKRKREPSASSTAKSSQPKARHTCNFCGKTGIRGGWAYVGHVRSHTGEKPFSCSSCGKCFLKKFNAICHLSDHKGERPFIKYETALHSVISRFKADQREWAVRKMYFCGFCDEKCKLEKDMFIHMSKHTDENLLSCSTCGETFTNTKDLYVHKKIHPLPVYKIAKNPLRCKYCEKKFTKPERLKNHLKTHKWSSMIACDKCGQKFRNQDKLLAHMKIHEGEKPYYCSPCRKRYKSHKVYLAHLKKHSKGNKYSCTICGKTYLFREKLDGHMKSHKYKWSCSICQKLFPNQKMVEKHVRLRHKSAFPAVHHGGESLDKIEFEYEDETQSLEKPQCSSAGAHLGGESLDRIKFEYPDETQSLENPQSSYTYAGIHLGGESLDKIEFEYEDETQSLENSQYAAVHLGGESLDKIKVEYPDETQSPESPQCSYTCAAVQTLTKEEQEDPSSC